MRTGTRPFNAIGRKRRTLGYTLLTLGTALALLWAQSRWWYRGYESGSWAVVCVRGILSIDDATGYPPPAPGITPFIGRGWIVFSMDSAAPGWTWLLSGDRVPVTVPGVGGPTGYINVLGVVDTFTTPASPWATGTSVVTVRSPGGVPVRCINIELWLLALGSLSLGVPLLASGVRARRRAITDMCTKCGYSLAGLAPNALCPECGKGAETKWRARASETRQPRGSCAPRAWMRLLQAAAATGGAVVLWSLTAWPRVSVVSGGLPWSHLTPAWAGADLFRGGFRVQPESVNVLTIPAPFRLYLMSGVEDPSGRSTFVPFGTSGARLSLLSSSVPPSGAEAACVRTGMRAEWSEPRPSPSAARWWPRPLPGGGWSAPMWMFGAALVVPWSIAHAARRLRRGRARAINPCATCGYNLTGLAPDAKCPECGNAPRQVASNREAVP